MIKSKVLMIVGKMTDDDDDDDWVKANWTEN